MTLTNDSIQQKLTAQFGEGFFTLSEQYGMLSFEAPKDQNLKVLQFLYDEPTLAFRFLTDICAVNDPEQPGKELSVVYHLHNLVENVRIRMKIYTAIDDPKIFTATRLFESANWMERETYDFYGVNFVGHPNLKRILNVDEMDYFPLRKEFPLEDQTRIDKDDQMFGRG